MKKDGLPPGSSCHLSSYLARGLICGDEMVLTIYLIGAKERMKLLSKKLYDASKGIKGRHLLIDDERSQLPRGDLSDNALASEFFLNEREVDLKAGHDRLLWLVEKLKEYDIYVD